VKVRQYPDGTMRFSTAAMLGRYDKKAFSMKKEKPLESLGGRPVEMWTRQRCTVHREQNRRSGLLMCYQIRQLIAITGAQHETWLGVLITNRADRMRVSDRESGRCRGAPGIGQDRRGGGGKRLWQSQTKSRSITRRTISKGRNATRRHAEQRVHSHMSAYS